MANGNVIIPRNDNLIVNVPSDPGLALTALDQQQRTQQQQQQSSRFRDGLLAFGSALGGNNIFQTVLQQRALENRRAAQTEDRRLSIRRAAAQLALQNLPEGAPGRAQAAEILREQGLGFLEGLKPQPEQFNLSPGAVRFEQTPGQEPEEIARGLPPASTKQRDAVNVRRRIIELKTKQKQFGLSPLEETELEVLDPLKSVFERAMKQESDLREQARKRKLSAQEQEKLSRLSQKLDSNFNFADAILRGTLGRSFGSTASSFERIELTEQQSTALGQAKAAVRSGRQRSAVIQLLKDEFGFSDEQIGASGI